MLLRDLYLSREWTATEIAAEIDTPFHQVLRTCTSTASRSAGVDHPRRRDGDVALQRLAALYEDPDVAALLRRHRIPERPVAGTITQRFPKPAAVTRTFLTEAYAEIGLACRSYRAAHRATSWTCPCSCSTTTRFPVRRSGAHFPWLLRQRDTH